jgi:hypothetical protein
MAGKYPLTKKRRAEVLVMRAMAVLLAAAAAVFSVVVPVDQGSAYWIGLLAISATAGGSAYAVSASKKWVDSNPRPLYHNL